MTSPGGKGLAKASTTSEDCWVESAVHAEPFGGVIAVPTVADLVPNDAVKQAALTWLGAGCEHGLGLDGPKAALASGTESRLPTEEGGCTPGHELTGPVRRECIAVFVPGKQGVGHVAEDFAAFWRIDDVGFVQQREGGVRAQNACILARQPSEEPKNATFIEGGFDKDVHGTLRMEGCRQADQWRRREGRQGRWGSPRGLPQPLRRGRQRA